MTKGDLIAKMAGAANISQVAAGKALNAFVEGVNEALARGDKVTLVGFGTFCVSQRAARKGRNPKTGDVINIPASTVPKFKPGAVLKDAVK